MRTGNCRHGDIGANDGCVRVCMCGRCDGTPWATPVRAMNTRRRSGAAQAPGNDLRQSLGREPREHGRAAQIARGKPTRIAQQPPEPFKTMLAQKPRRALLPAGQEIERRADADETNLGHPRKAPCSEDLPAPAAKGDDAESRAGPADALNRGIGLARSRVEIRPRRMAAHEPQSWQTVDQPRTGALQHLRAGTE